MSPLIVRVGKAWHFGSEPENLPQWGRESLPQGHGAPLACRAVGVGRGPLGLCATHFPPGEDAYY